MKKTIAIALVLALVASLSMSIFATSTERRTASLNKGKAVIDGEYDDIYQNGTKNLIDTVKTPTIRFNADSGYALYGDQGSRGWWQGTWDSDGFLYLYMFMKDTTMLSEEDTKASTSNKTNIDDTDCWQVHIEPTGTDLTAYSGKQCIFSANVLSANWVEMGGNYADVVEEYKTKKLSDGYVLEAKVNLNGAGAGVTVAEGLSFSFDIQYQDNYSKEQSRCMCVAWNDDIDKAWQNPSVCGIVTLSGTAAAAGNPPAGGDNPTTADYTSAAVLAIVASIVPVTIIARKKDR